MNRNLQHELKLQQLTPRKISFHFVKSHAKWARGEDCVQVLWLQGRGMAGSEGGCSNGTLKPRAAFSSSAHAAGTAYTSPVCQHLPPVSQLKV